MGSCTYATRFRVVAITHDMARAEAVEALGWTKGDVFGAVHSTVERNSGCDKLIGNIFGCDMEDER